jgi:hypothetical protein
MQWTRDEHNHDINERARVVSRSRKVDVGLSTSEDRTI